MRPEEKNYAPYNLPQPLLKKDGIAHQLAGKRTASVIIKNILCVVDLSQFSSVVYQNALLMARKFKARLSVAHVISPRIFESVPAALMEQAVQEAREEARAHLHHLTQQQSIPQVKQELLLEEGAVSDTILRLSKQCHADILVLGTRAAKGLDRLLAGSVAEEVFRQAECPVLVVPPNALSARAAHISTILYATEFAESASQLAAAYAFALARKYRARLALLHVLERALTEYGEDLAQIMELAAQRGRKLFPPGRHSGSVPLQVEVGCGPVAPRIVRAACEMSADFIVMGTKAAKAEVSHHPEGVVCQVIQAANCPVLTVRSEVGLLAA